MPGGVEDSVGAVASSRTEQVTRSQGFANYACFALNNHKSGSSRQAYANRRYGEREEDTPDVCRLTLKF